MDKSCILLFDVDGTLTKSRNSMTNNMKSLLTKASTKYILAIVSGSDISKTKEQIPEDILKLFTYVFSQNGVVTYKNGELFQSKSITQFLGEHNLKSFINECLLYLSKLDIPIKRGNFIEFREGMLNISPIGRNCSQQEREEFEIYDNENQIRSKMIQHLTKTFPDLNLTYSIGGQISFDVFPSGWNKTYCLQYINTDIQVIFFGDKTYSGGNDYEIYNHPRVHGKSVKNPEDTEMMLTELLKE